ncbi:twin-arginine translocation signal domain-containing protein, partial [Eggerthella sp. BIOML-A4]
MTKQVHGQTGAHAPLSRRDFLTRAGLTVGAAAG